MKKVVLASTGIILIGLVATPKFVANSVDEKLLTITNTINKNPAYSATIEEHNSKWFSTSAIIKIGIDPKIMANANYPEVEKMFAEMKLEVNFSAQHGPVLTKDGVSLGLLSWDADVLGESLRDKIDFDTSSPIYHITGQTNLFGQTRYSDEVPSFTVKENPVFTETTFSGWAGTGNISNDHITYQGKMDSFNAKSALGDIHFTSWSVDLDMKINLLEALEGSFYDSTSSMLIKNIAYESAMTDESIVLENIKMEGVTEFNKTDDLLDTKVNMTLANFTNANINLTDVVMTTEFNNLQEKFFKAYQQFANKLATEPQKMQENLQAFMQEAGLAQLEASPEFNISSISGKVNDGQFSGSINSKIHNVSELPAEPADPSFWLTHIMADAQLSVDKSVALLLTANSVKSQLMANPNTAQMSEQEMTDIATQQATAVLQSFMQQGMLTETDNEYKLQASLKDGKALLNGNPMPLPIGK